MERIKDYIWVEDPERSWVLAKLEKPPADNSPNEVLSVKILDTGKSASAVLGSVVPATISFGSKEREEDYLKKLTEPLCHDNMIQMEELNEPFLLHNIHNRFKKHVIYTYIEEILVSVNPYKYFTELYAEETMAKYHDSQRLHDCPPHIYGVANSCYLGIVNTKKSHSILINGESGTVKTENTKFAIRYLTYLSHKQGNSKHSLEEQILNSNPLLEAFGNACTVTNYN